MCMCHVRDCVDVGAAVNGMFVGAYIDGLACMHGMCVDADVGIREQHMCTDMCVDVCMCESRKKKKMLKIDMHLISA